MVNEELKNYIAIYKINGVDRADNYKYQSRNDNQAYNLARIKADELAIKSDSNPETGNTRVELSNLVEVDNVREVKLREKISIELSDVAKELKQSGYFES